ncbi:3-oxoacyl-ACP synthase III family protein [Lentzea sp. NPDC051213]|uniref:3-oxoacyl-ACP synthase III family protein n=1 Tax=Lentzea sp. NPDC051213 TaxID=3364126 RepID=UPI0037ADAEC1
MVADESCHCGCALATWAEGDNRNPVGIIGCGSYLPPRVVSNEEVAAAAGVPPGWIEERTGILSRRFADEDQAASDLAAHACAEALEDAGITAADVSVIVLATSTPDSPQPPTACVLQHRIGAHGAAAFDVNAVCSGFVFALDVARRMVADGGFALVVGVDVYSRIIDPADRRTAVLFGDGAGAVVLGPSATGAIHGVRLASFGSHRELIGVPAGGSRIPPSKESLLAGEHYFQMNGRAVREFVKQEVPGAVHDFIGHLPVRADAVRHFIPHQANRIMLGELATEIGLPNARMHETVREFGNTGAASIPVTLAAARGEIARGDDVLLTAFGGGMALGLALVRW